MSTQCHKCGREKEASRPLCHLCRACDTKEKVAVLTKFIDFGAMELKIMAHPIAMEAVLPTMWAAKKHNSQCGCTECVEALLERWIKQKSSHLIEYHMRFNAGSEEFDPNLVHAMIVQMCLETKVKIMGGVEAQLASAHFNTSQLTSKLLKKDLEIVQLKRELEARRAAATATVPSTEGRVFREE